MKRNNKIYLFQDQEDFEIELTKDPVVNVIGTKGSGKSTLSLRYLNDPEYVVVNCDQLFGLPEDREISKDLLKVKEMLEQKFGTINSKEFIHYYDVIITYILEQKKKVFIEGNVIQGIEPITLLKGKLIIKRTAVVKSFIRTVKRDYKNSYFMQKEQELHGKFAKIIRLYKVIKRRIKIFKEYKDIEKKIQDLEK